MDGKKTKRRRSGAGKRHGRLEEKPKTSEVMNEKEKQDRLDAASALSSLMFLPPKSSNEDENSENKPQKESSTPSTAVTQFLRLPSTTGNPVLSAESETQNASGRDVSGARPLSEKEINARNSFILNQLKSQLNKALQNKDNPQLFLTDQRVKSAPMNEPPKAQPESRSVHIPRVATNPKLQVPLTVMPQTHTVNKQVAEALRQAVSKNNRSLQTTLKITEQNPETTSSSSSAATAESVMTRHEEEKMETDSLPSVRIKDGTDTKLPLKKRRLVGVDDSVPTAELNITSSLLQSSLTSAKQIENILQMAKDYPLSPQSANMNISLSSSLSSVSKLPADQGYRPVQFDPRTSLMVLSDLKFALTPDEDGDLPLHIAVVHENTELVKKFIDIMAISGKTVDRFNKLQQTPLHLAVLVNKPDIVMALLEAGANPNHLDRHGYTAIHICVNKQFHECMDTVFEHSKFDVNVNTRDYEGYPPMHTCVELNTLDFLRMLREQGAEINCQDGKAGRSVLLYAVEYNRVEIVEYLLDEGADPDLMNYASVSPLMTAQAGNMQAILKHLNKALDIRNDENSYPRKVPISRTVSRSNSFVKDEKHELDGIPVYYEYPDPDCFKREPLSRQSSVSAPIDLSSFRREDLSSFKREPLSRQSSSAPIDLSMKRNSESPTMDWEPTIRGKPGRRKSKKEHRNHKEKQSNKSMKEAHASIVAALERKNPLKHSHSRIPNGSATPEEIVKIKKEKLDYAQRSDSRQTLPAEPAVLKSGSIGSLLSSLTSEQFNSIVERMKEQMGRQSNLRSLGHQDAKKVSDESERNSDILENVRNEDEMEGRSSESDKNSSGKSKLNSDGESVEACKSRNKRSNQEDAESSKHESEPVITDTSSQADHTIVTEAEQENMETTESDSMPVLLRFSSLTERVSNENSDMFDDDDDDDDDDLPELLEKEVPDTEASAAAVKSIDNYKDTCTVTAENCEKETVKGSQEADSKRKIALESFKEELTENKELICDESDVTDDQMGANNETEISVSNSLVDKQVHDETDSVYLNQSDDKSPLGSSQASQGFEPLKSPEKLDTKHTMVKNCDGPLEANLTDEKDQQKDLKTDKSVINKLGKKKNTSTQDIVEQDTVAMETDEDEGEKSLVIDEESSSVETKRKYANRKGKGKKKNSPNPKLNSRSGQSQVGSEKAKKNKVSDRGVGKSSDFAVTKTGTKRRVLLPKESSPKVTLWTSSAGQEGYTTASSDQEEASDKGKAIDEKQDKNVNNLLRNMPATSTIYSSLRTVLNLQGISDKDVNEVTSGSLNSESKSLVITTGAQSSADNSGFTNEAKVGFSEISGNSVAGSAVKNTTVASLSKTTLSDSKQPLLKTGQSHTLYYHDGEDFKPVKIFIDNSEQSSLVLQRLVQTAQLSNLRRHGGAGDALKNSVSSMSLSSHQESLNQTLGQMITVTQSTSNKPVTAAQTATNANKSGIGESERLPPAATLSSDKVKTVSIMGVRPSIFPLTRVRPPLLSSMQNKVNKQKETEQSKVTAASASSVATDSAKAKAVVNAGLKLGLNTITKSNSEAELSTIAVTSSSAGLKKPNSFAHRPKIPVGLITPEGTLTRVNPDVKNRLSLALQSSNRKFALTHSDSDSGIKSSSKALETVVAESRQQL